MTEQTPGADPGLAADGAITYLHIPATTRPAEEPR
jgi:hypothetical protein